MKPQRSARSPWSLAWLSWSALTLSLPPLPWLVARQLATGRLAANAQRWESPCLRALAGLGVVFASSTVLSELVPYQPLVTASWALPAAACFGCRRAAPGMSLVAITLALSSALKLIGWDWVNLDMTTRFVLSLLVGTALLIGPLFSRPATQSAAAQTTPPDAAAHESPSTEVPTASAHRAAPAGAQE